MPKRLHQPVRPYLLSLTVSIYVSLRHPQRGRMSWQDLFLSKRRTDKRLVVADREARAYNKKKRNVAKFSLVKLASPQCNFVFQTHRMSCGEAQKSETGNCAMYYQLKKSAAASAVDLTKAAKLYSPANTIAARRPRKCGMSSHSSANLNSAEESGTYKKRQPHGAA